MKQIFFIVILLLPFLLNATSKENMVSVGQGTAAPNVNSLVNIGTGFIGSENPAGVVLTSGYRATVQYYKSDTSATGFEGGYTNKKFGFAVGQLAASCTRCKPIQGVVLGSDVLNWMSLGIRYKMANEIPTYGLGFLFNNKGRHRLGFNLNVVNPNVKESSTANYGFGYAYVSGKDTITIEQSQPKSLAPGATSEAVSLMSIGYQKRVDDLEVSLTYEKNSSSTSATFLMGAGFRGESWHLGVYTPNTQTLLLMLSGFF